MSKLFEIIIKEEAKQDLSDAMQWYASKSENLDKKFLKAVEDALLKIKQNPHAFRKVYKHFRQTRVSGFPYVLLYEMDQNILVIYSVFNTWQLPGKKFRRLKK